VSVIAANKPSLEKKAINRNWAADFKFPRKFWFSVKYPFSFPLRTPMVTIRSVLYSLMQLWTSKFKRSRSGFSGKFSFLIAISRRGKCPRFWPPTSSILFAYVQCKSTSTVVILFAFTCLETMLTSKLITEIIENHSELYVGAINCNKFVSSRSW